MHSPRSDPDTLQRSDATMAPCSFPPSPDIQDGHVLPESAEDTGEVEQSTSPTSLCSAPLTVLDGDIIPSELEPPRRKGERLGHAEIRLVLLLRDQGLSQSQIGKRLNCSQVTISRILAEWADTSIEAKAIIKKKARKLAEKLVETADNDQVLEIFDRTDILPKKRNVDESGKVNVMIGIKLPGND